jgi:hypothetical protein
MTQATIANYPTGGTTNAEQRDSDDHQAPLSGAQCAGATVDVPEHVGAYERTRATHAGEVACWSDGTDRVSVVQLIGDGVPYEVTGADASVPNPGRIITAAPDRAHAIQRACEYMRGESIDPTF